MRVEEARGLRGRGDAGLICDRATTPRPVPLLEQAFGLAGPAPDCFNLCKHQVGINQMSLQFRCAIDGMEVWSATGGGLSFVITYASQTGTGFRGRPGYVASWRPHYVSKGAIKVGGSPFKTFADAEDACNAMRDHLKYVPKIPIDGKDTPIDDRVPARE